jgi:hypothetical protein
MLEFWEIEDDPDLGFVIVDREFELWLIAALGISFEDISYATLGEDDDQEIELIMDYGDFMNLQDLYEEYTLYGWSLLTDDEEALKDWEVVFALRAEDKPTCPHCGGKLGIVIGGGPIDSILSQVRGEKVMCENCGWQIRKDLFGSETRATQRIKQRGYNPRRYEKKSTHTPSYYRHKVRSGMRRDISAAITPAQVIGVGALLFLGMLMLRKK